MKNAKKNFLKNFSKSWPKRLTSNGVFSKKERENPFPAAKEDDALKLPWNQKESVRHIFDSYCKKILRQENADMQRSEVRRRARECNFSELPPELLAKLCSEDVHPVEFEVCGYRIPVNDDRLAAALAKLLREKRDVILLSYFLGMTDREISEKLNIVHQTVSKRRLVTLKELREYLMKEGFEWPDK